MTSVALPLSTDVVILSWKVIKFVRQDISVDEAMLGVLNVIEIMNNIAPITKNIFLFALMWCDTY